MLKNKKKIALIIAALAVIASIVFTACANTGDKDEANAPSGENEQNTASPDMEYTLLYNGCEIKKEVGVQRLAGKEGPVGELESYSGEYYYYTFGKALGKEKAAPVEEYENDFYILPESGRFGPDNELAASKDINPLPRTAKEVKPDEIISQLSPLADDLDANIIYEIDLDGDGKSEYIVDTLRIKGNVCESEVSLYNADFKKTARLAYMNAGGYEGGETADLLTSVDFFDIDRDGNMEILINLPEWEGRGKVSIVRYENGKILGETDVEASIKP